MKNIEKSLLGGAAVLGFAAVVAFGIAMAQVRPDSSQLTFQAQGGTLANSSTVSATNTAVVVTVTGVAGQSGHLYSVDGVCSAGTSSITVDDEATEIFSTPIATTQVRFTWAVPLTMGDGNDMVITLAACGGGNTGTLIIQADQY